MPRNALKHWRLAIFRIDIKHGRGICGLKRIYLLVFNFASKSDIHSIK